MKTKKSPQNKDTATERKNGRANPELCRKTPKIQDERFDDGYRSKAKVILCLLIGFAVDFSGAFSAELPLMKGTKVLVTQGHNTSDTHNGTFDKWAIDLQPTETGRLPVPILASESGIVERAHWSGSNNYGWRVAITGPDGFTSHCGHLAAIVVKAGDTVRAGQHIGFMGNTGKSLGGAHLHYVERLGSDAVNPEPLGGYTGIKEGDLLTSANKIYKPISVGMYPNHRPGEGSLAVMERYMNFTSVEGESSTKPISTGRDFWGTPSDDGAGEFLHQWEVPPGNQSDKWRWGGYLVQNFSGGEVGDCAIVYNPQEEQAFSISGGFWQVFRYGTGDGSGFGPTISVGGIPLGFPLSNEYSEGNKTLQCFEGGYLEWDPENYAVNLLDQDKEYLFTTSESDDDPVHLDINAQSQNSLDIEWPAFQNVASYAIHRNGESEEIVTAMAPMIAQFDSSSSYAHTAGAEFEPLQTGALRHTINNLEPGSKHTIQVVALNSAGDSVGRTQISTVNTLSPSLQIKSSTGNKVCEIGSFAYLWANGSGPTNLVDFQWTHYTGVKGTNAFLHVRPVSFRDAGKYTFTAIDANGQSVTTNIYLLVSGISYADWVTGFYTPSVFRAGRDPIFAPGTEHLDSDISNAEAFMAGVRSSGDNGNPLSIDSIDWSGSNAVLRMRRLSGYQPQIEISSDLKTWVPVSPSRVVPKTVGYFGDGLTCKMDVQVPAEGRTQFYRENTRITGLHLIYSNLFDNTDTLSQDFAIDGEDCYISGGYLRCYNLKADSNGGQASTRCSWPARKRFRVVLRNHIKNAGDVSAPALKFQYKTADDEIKTAFSIAHAKVVASAGEGLIDRDGIVIVQGEAQPHLDADAWRTAGIAYYPAGEFFTELIEFDPTTSTLIYSNGGHPEKFRIVLPADATDLFLMIDSWGWGSGHGQTINDLAIYIAP